MAKLKISEEQKDTLGFKANHLYQTLKLAFEIGEECILDSAKRMCEHDLGSYLRELIQPTREVVDLCKDGKRIKGIEGPVLLYLTMSNSYPTGSVKELPKLEVAENPNDGMGGLQAFIDAEEPSDAKSAVVLRLIQTKAKGLRDAGRYLSILKCMDYIMEKYPGPERFANLELRLGK